MSYEGQILNLCPGDIDFSNTWAVVVSGVSWNPCGHMLFCCGTNSNDSWYFHVAGQGVKEAMGVWAYPKFMRGDANYNRYLVDNGKHEIRRLNARITNPAGAYQMLTQYMSNKWFWGVLPHNCAAFAKDIISAGGGNVKVLLNCPDQDFLRRTGEAALEGLKRVPRGPLW
jgi:hypothetical protein